MFLYLHGLRLYAVRGLEIYISRDYLKNFFQNKHHLKLVSPVWESSLEFVA